jgi:kinetochore protein NNF1
MTEQSTHIRYDRLKTVCYKALEESQKALTGDNLISCYPSLTNSDQGKQLLSTITAQLVDSWSDNTKREFDAIFKERDIETKLNELDDLIADASKNGSQTEDGVPIDELTSTNILSSHMIPVKEKKLAQLKEQLHALRQGNVSLLDALNEQLSEAKSFKKEVSGSLQTIKDLNTVGDNSKLKESLDQLIDITKHEEQAI